MEYYENLFLKEIATPLGKMVAIGDDEGLHILEFMEQKASEKSLAELFAPIRRCHSPPLRSIEKELKSYFKGELRDFTTPCHLVGTPFQKSVWQALQKIPFGETQSYAALASSINKPTAYRAAAQANGANTLAVIIPCHRVINSNGELGGYSSGLSRKRWLLNHESKFK